MAMNGLIIAAIEMVTIFKLEGRRPLLHFISVGVVLVGVSYLMLTIRSLNFELLAICVMLLLTVGEILSMPFMNSFWISRTEQLNRGQYAALYTVAWASAQAVGPLTGALIAENYGYNVLWIITGSVCIALSVFYRQLQHR